MQSNKVWGPKKKATNGQEMYYSEYIQSSLWRDHPLRSIIIARDKWCRLCGEMEQLQIHHIFYSAVWGEEKEEDLTLLCGECHDIITDKTRREKYEARTITPEEIKSTKPGKESVICKQRQELAPEDVPIRVIPRSVASVKDQYNVFTGIIQDHWRSPVADALRSTRRPAQQNCQRNEEDFGKTEKS